MAKGINFNTIKKQYLPITLTDEKNTTLMVGTPTGAVLNELISIQSTLKDVDENEVTTDDLSSLYAVCAKILSRNKGGVIVTSKQLEELLDFEDIKILMSEYMNFISEVMSAKN